MVWISLIDAVDWKSIGIKFHRSTGRRSERGFVWLTIRAQYVFTGFAEYAESAFPSFNDAEPTESPRQGGVLVVSTL